MLRASRFLMFAAAASLVLMTSTSATAATARAGPRWTAGDIACNQLSSSLCMNANVSNLGENVKGYGYTPGHNQDMDVTWQTSACGGNGLVTETCPFKEGTGLNAELVGDRIVKLSNDDHPTWKYAGVFLSDNLVVTETSGDGELWVQAGSPGPGSFGNWINVSLSDRDSGVNPADPHPMMVCSDGSGTPGVDLDVDAEWFPHIMESTACDWHEKAG